jgi:hypothetical protein
MNDAESASSGVGIIVGSGVEPRHGQLGTALDERASSGTIEKRGAAWSGGETRTSSSNEIGQSLLVEGDHNSQVPFPTYSAFIISHAVSSGPHHCGPGETAKYIACN